jgi:hypothetical protein
MKGVTTDFGIGKRLTNLPALRQVGFSANRRLLGVQRLSHNPIRTEQAFTAVHHPIITNDGHRMPGYGWATAAPTNCSKRCWCSDCSPHGFLNRDLRGLLAGLLGKTPTRSAPTKSVMTCAGSAPTALSPVSPKSTATRSATPGYTTPC